MAQSKIPKPEEVCGLQGCPKMFAPGQPMAIHGQSTLCLPNLGRNNYKAIGAKDAEGKNVECEQCSRPISWDKTSMSNHRKTCSYDPAKRRGSQTGPGSYKGSPVPTVSNSHPTRATSRQEQHKSARKAFDDARKYF